MSGGVGGMFSAAWFRALIIIAQKIMPGVKRDHPNDDQTWLLAKALSQAYSIQKREADERKEQAAQRRESESQSRRRIESGISTGKSGDGD